MNEDILFENLLFAVDDVFGKKIRITKRYWEQIKSDKHRELGFGYTDAVDTLKNPEEVRLSIKDEYIRLFFKRYGNTTLIVVVKYLNGDGFVVTVYQTSKVKRKGEIVWSKQQKKT